MAKVRLAKANAAPIDEADFWRPDAFRPWGARACDRGPQVLVLESAAAGPEAFAIGPVAVVCVLSVWAAPAYGRGTRRTGGLAYPACVPTPAAQASKMRVAVLAPATGNNNWVATATSTVAFAPPHAVIGEVAVEALCSSGESSDVTFRLSAGGAAALDRCARSQAVRDAALMLAVGPRGALAVADPPAAPAPPAATRGSAEGLTEAAFKKTPAGRRRMAEAVERLAAYHEKKGQAPPGTAIRVVVFSPIQSAHVCTHHCFYTCLKDVGHLEASLGSSLASCSRIGAALRPHMASYGLMEHLRSHLEAS